jgi:KAP family P-loop domain
LTLAPVLHTVDTKQSPARDEVGGEVADMGAAVGTPKSGYRILLDAPARHPALGYPGIADALAGIVMESAPRFAIGIFGGWGSGKTTLMEAIEKRLDSARAVPVSFSAWRYEKEEHLILPLLDTIRDALVVWGEEQPRNAQASQATARTIGRVMRAIVAGTSVKIGVPGAIDVSFEANKALEAGRRMSQERAEARVPRSSYHASFRALKQAFEEFAGPEAKRRIVVFIDDLDRCLPASALQVLESMKLFFDLDGFVFVVGLDRKIIEYVVDSKYGLGANGDGEQRLETRVLGEEYIKKIFQVPYTLAPVDVGQLRAFLDSVYADARLTDAQRDEFVTVVEPHLPFLVRDGSVNPREVKRYLNAYTITTKIDGNLDPNAVLAMLTLDFRTDWEQVESSLLLNGDVFVDALRRLQGGAATALDDIGGELRLPDDFITYTQIGQPGYALAQVNDIERYFRNVGTAGLSRDIDLLQLLPRIGAVRRDMATLSGDPAQAKELLSKAGAELSLLQSRLHSTPQTPSPLAALILDDIEQFTAAAGRLEHSVGGPGVPGGPGARRLGAARSGARGTRAAHLAATAGSLPVAGRRAAVCHEVSFLTAASAVHPAATAPSPRASPRPLLGRTSSARATAANRSRIQTTVS